MTGSGHDWDCSNVLLKVFLYLFLKFYFCIYQNKKKNIKKMIWNKTINVFKNIFPLQKQKKKKQAAS
jgi:hypothetical protein